ncbi:proline-rich transmembrane protein 1-like [Saccoglossus kowalevskii]
MMSDKAKLVNDGDPPPYLTFPGEQVLPPSDQVIYTTTGAGYVHVTESTPNDYMWLSVLTCLFCCWPLGLLAISNSCEVQSALEVGNIPRAKEKSVSAVKLNIAAILSGVTITIAVNLIVFLVVLPNQNQDDY